MWAADNSLLSTRLGKHKITDIKWALQTEKYVIILKVSQKKMLQIASNLSYTAQVIFKSCFLFNGLSTI